MSDDDYFRDILKKAGIHCNPPDPKEKLIPTLLAADELEFLLDLLDSHTPRTAHEEKIIDYMVTEFTSLLKDNAQ